MADLMLERPRKVTVVEAIVEQIVRQIQTGKLKPGDRLPSERQLIEMLGVSRSSVREALQGLAMMGLVESRHGQGSFISPNLVRLFPNMESAVLPSSLQRTMRLHLVEARRTVECPVAELAAARADEDGLARLRNAFAAYKQLMESKGYHEALNVHHHAFHVGLADLSQNPFFTPVVETLLRAVPQSLRESEFNTLGPQELQAITQAEVAIHRAILTAVERREPAAARAAMEEHMDFELRLIRQIFPERDHA
ncbi:MAG: FadR family transcriptional regulator [Oscillochloris sp.]|nr:FadR family transcriptional regulator [Oscillochloris sp.]